MEKEKLGQFIAQNRKERGLTQQELAEKLHVTNKAVSKWETGQCYPDVTLLELLAESLGLSIEELMTCRHEETGELAMEALLDMTDETLRKQKKRDNARLLLLVLIIVLVLPVICFFVFGTVSEERTVQIVSKETVDNRQFLYVAEQEHLIQLECKGNFDYNSVYSGDGRYYKIDCSWNRWTYRGTVRTCESNNNTLGSPMDERGASLEVDSLFGVALVWKEIADRYPDPYRESGYVTTFRYWYGTETENETMATVLCRAAMEIDYDQDGIIEIIAWSIYEEKPYVVYDWEDGTLVTAYLDSIPTEWREQLRAMAL